MVTLIKSDLEFILEQIEIAEAHTAGGDLLTLVGNSFVPFGLRTVDGSFNNILPGQTDFGAADQDFPLLLEQEFRNDGDGDAFGPITNTNYASTTNVVDADPRIISNLIVDQTITNPAAVEAYVAAGLGILADGTQLDPGRSRLTRSARSLASISSQFPRARRCSSATRRPTKASRRPSTAGSRSLASSSITASIWSIRAAPEPSSFRFSPTIRSISKAPPQTS